MADFQNGGQLKRQNSKCGIEHGEMQCESGWYALLSHENLSVECFQLTLSLKYTFLLLFVNRPPLPRYTRIAIKSLSYLESWWERGLHICFQGQWIYISHSIRCRLNILSWKVHYDPLVLCQNANKILKFTSV